MSEEAKGQAQWSAEEDAQLVELRREGWPVARIASVLGRTVSAVGARQTVLRKRGLMDFCPAPEPWRPEEDDWLRGHYGRSGWTLRTCAEWLGRSQCGVKARVRRLGVAAQRTGRPPSGESLELMSVPRPRKRRCHDCGRPTWDYRCSRCWERLREKYDCED